MPSSIDACIVAAPSDDLRAVAVKVKEGARISDEECLLLFEKGSVGFVGDKMWKEIWIAFAIYSLVIAVLFFFLFKHKHDIRELEKATMAH